MKSVEFLVGEELIGQNAGYVHDFRLAGHRVVVLAIRPVSADLYDMVGHTQWLEVCAVHERSKNVPESLGLFSGAFFYRGQAEPTFWVRQFSLHN